MDKIITLDEVAEHNNKSSVWIIIHNNVYDVTSFLEEHPGGEDSLLEVAGKDGTQGFEDVAHSDDARELLKKYKVGILHVDKKPHDFIECSRFHQECARCSTTSCPYAEDMDKQEKTWRTYDGSSSKPAKVVPKKSVHTSPKVERRVQSIVVPKERRPAPPCDRPSNLKYVILALAGAIVIGFALQKYLAK